MMSRRCDELSSKIDSFGEIDKARFQDDRNLIKIKKKTIACDCDEVLAYFVPALAEWHNSEYFYDETSRPILDASSGLWCSGAGMSPDPVVDAVKEQLDKLSYAPSFQMTHEGAFEWAEAIADHGGLRDRDLQKVFFTMCGSTSVDTALKIALAYHRANGEGISVGGIVPNRQTFSACLLPGVDHLPHTHSLEHAAFTKGQPDWGCHLADNLEDIVALHGANNVAGVIVEPVAGSAGVLIPPKGYLERLRELCDKHNLLLIFDEVITGFGRLGGAPFAADYFDVTPDMITTAKNLTGAV
eukprot:g4427.t1